MACLEGCCLRLESGTVTLGRRLGHGATSVVHAAQLTPSPKTSAAVVAKVGVTPGPFLANEAKMLQAAAGHKNIIQLISLLSVDLTDPSSNLRDLAPLGAVQAEESLQLLILERCQCSLANFCQHIPSERYSAWVMRSVLDGLVHLHSLNIVHRDIKDANIMIAYSGDRVAIADLGLAGRIPEGQTSIEWHCGTQGFAAPEVLQQRSGGKASDVFSLGVVLFLMLTGSHPFLEDTKLETMMATLHRQLPCEPAGLLKKSSQEACAMLQLMLCRDFQTRPCAAALLEHAWFSKEAGHGHAHTILPTGQSPSPALESLRAERQKARKPELLKKAVTQTDSRAREKKLWRRARDAFASFQELLHSMGLPVVEAESEAEATCAQLCREGQVYAAVTEDMDVLTFGAPRQVKNLFDVEGSRTRQPKPAREVDLSLVQDALSYTQEQFIEFCILCGCDYLPHLPRIGPKTAAQLLQREGSLDAAVAACRAGKGPKGCTIPEDWDWVAAKRIFQKGAELPELSVVATSAADCEKLRSLLVEKHQFNPSRVGNMVDRLWKVRQPGGPVLQRRLDSFFQSSPKRPRREKCTSAPKEPIDVEKWRCPQCTFENDSLPFCEMCEKPRPAQPNASERLRPSSVCIDLD
ncbi:unnamed protein product [Effrenium voratum]|uniref:Protein kinase domain-containing protein n=1 Tax=Effrenium voratum TaxID=2562239 RepID=A0AA36I6X3_9DINO|nr:unnamed protein product [Effrenium voratum]